MAPRTIRLPLQAFLECELEYVTKLSAVDKASINLAARRRRVVVLDNTGTEFATVNLPDAEITAGAPFLAAAESANDEAAIPAAPRDLAALAAGYLAARRHTLSTARLDAGARLIEQARYVRGEVDELREALEALVDEPGPRESKLQHARHEVADVAISLAVLAGYLRTTVEACIAEKTNADRGRG